MGEAKQLVGAVYNELIETTVNKIKYGNQLVGKTHKAFENVTSAVSKGSEHVSEILAASEEQTQQIQESDNAVSAMDTITRQNSAHSEETASVAAEMASQVEQMNIEVIHLATLVNGGTVHPSSKALQKRSNLMTP